MKQPEQVAAFTVRLARTERDQLAEIAEREHRSLGAEARRAIIAHIEQESPAEEQAA